MIPNVANSMSDNKNVRRLISIVEEFRKLDPEMQAQTILLFLLVVARPGITMKELAQNTELSSASISRNIAALGETHRGGQPGHNLLRAYEDPLDRRTKRVELTAKGRAVCSSLITALTGAVAAA
ncbi:MarR family winged helix-turn-helix transcriptional regulator [Sinorhizobium medicae]|uniref:MarR family winged helix-turn-helix transcriptional regulator n=1 Tax=Sinorhizobium medicae TaxID=110321 RepID=UPI001911DEE8|nr:winged helix DNA-binding protein [Sinorhizobium medicae]